MGAWNETVRGFAAARVILFTCIVSVI